MEKLFVNRNFPHIDLVPVSNGETWSVEMISKQISSLYRVKDVQAEKVIVWIDREGRTETEDQIRVSIRDALVDAGANVESIIICVPDRMTENIILADEQLIRSEFNIENYSYAGDGSHGKGRLKTLYREKNENYKETFHGANLLKKVHRSRAAECSESANSFYSGFDFACWWRR